MEQSEREVTRRAMLGAVASSSAFLCQAQTPVRRELPSDVLAPFSKKARDILARMVNDPQFRGRIDPETGRALLRAEGRNSAELMAKLLPLARTGARPPLSKYYVGAVLEGVSGALYLGANIEVPGQPLGFCVHAEQAACANAYVSNERGIRSIALTAAPCGHCRQFLNEFSPEGEIQVFVKGAPMAKLSALLPRAFGPANLGLKVGALPVRETALQLSAADAVAMAALDATKKSYSPYTHSPSGAALRTSDGRIFAGSYIENAAFNPSLPPLQAALAGLFASGSQASDISAVVLVEVQGSPISQNHLTRETLSSLAPAARYELLRAKRIG